MSSSITSRLFYSSPMSSTSKIRVALEGIVALSQGKHTKHRYSNIIECYNYTLTCRIYSWVSPLSIGIVRRAGEFGPLPYAHFSDSFVPATNHLTFTNFKLEWLATIPRGVKLLAAC